MSNSERPAPYDVLRGRDGYPADLARITDPPAVLHVLGGLTAAPHVAIVGSRECTRYGRTIAERLASELAAAGIVIVSGLARGIDAAAHRGALAVGGRTVAVLPGGLHPIYPRHHRPLARRIVSHGALLAEHDPGTAIRSWQFPKRNRIIAGVSLVTVIVEAATRSGARITADLALDYDREVLVVPGPITSATSAGCHALLTEGACPCTESADVIAQLPPAIADRLQVRSESPVPADLAGLEQALLEEIRRRGTVSLDVLLEHTGMAPAELLATVGALEIRGLVRRLVGDLVGAPPAVAGAGSGPGFEPGGV